VATPLMDAASSMISQEVGDGQHGLPAKNTYVARISSQDSVAAVQTTEPVACSVPSNGSTLLRFAGRRGGGAAGQETHIVVCSPRCRQS